MQAFQSKGACPARRLQRRACTVASAASATADGGAGAGQPAGVVISPIQRLVAFQQAFWKFLRPHTIRGTILGSMAVTARALIESPVVSAQTYPSQYSHQCTCRPPGMSCIMPSWGIPCITAVPYQKGL